MINLFQPALGQAELDAVADVFASNWVGKGPKTALFEQQFAAHLGVDAAFIHSISCCTEGLFQAMTLLDIKAGDEVILPSISFVGAGNAIVASGATPVFCDVDPHTLNPTAEMIAAQMTPKTKAVMILHYGGVPCEMDAICALTQQHNLALIEDSACSVASTYQGKACGTMGDVGVWSFDAMKILVTGDGGMIYCRSEELAQRAEDQLMLGLQSKSGFSNDVDSRWWAFEVSGAERRGIMNDIASAIGIEQLKKLPTFIAQRRRITAMYNDALSNVSWVRRPPAIPPHMTSSYYFYWIQTAPDVRDDLAHYLRQHNIYTSFRYYPLHRVQFYENDAHLPHTEIAADTTLCLPLHQALTDNDIGYIVDHVKNFGRQQ
ncbi:MAG: DegT/DnrJ/EryC1/StrS family aminotransferase [Chloroflexota bacterium]